MGKLIMLIYLNSFSLLQHARVVNFNMDIGFKFRALGTCVIYVYWCT